MKLNLHLVNMISFFFGIALQVLMQRLEQGTKSKIFLIKKLDKAKEDIDDLRFQVSKITFLFVNNLLKFF